MSPRRRRHCRSCDSALPGSRRLLGRLALGAAPMALLAAAGAWVLLDPNPNQGFAARAAQYAERSEPEPTTSVALRRAYDENPRAADARFKSRHLKITGTLAGPPRFELGGLTLLLATGAASGPIVVETAAATDARVRRLKAGDPARLGCVCRGLFGGQVLLNECHLEADAEVGSL